ncbi:MAG: ABC transporter ATP-binding protein, partial [Anaerolineales bacterium]|nr:ABC transporter ATP-binding protein [Anaerolineales bacterium]
HDLSGVPTHLRGFGLMFQDYALFPHLDAFENVAFGLRMARLPQEQVARQVNEVLELVGLAGFGQREVQALSGGEQQRVALARSLAPRPRLLMLDEPLGSLDRALRERLVSDVRQILRQMRQTAIYVTHDQEEAFALADRVAVMNAGRVEQSGDPQQIYRQPANVFVARFLGLSNLMAGEVRLVDSQPVAFLPIGQAPAPGMSPGKATFLLRPDAALLDGSGTLQLAGQVVERSFRGNLCRVVVSAHGLELSFDFLSSAPLPTEGQPIQLSFDPTQALQAFS